MNLTVHIPSAAASVASIATSRIQVVDALRGFALLGILLVHASNWFDGGPLPDSVNQVNANSVVNDVVQTVIGVFFSGKFYTFFSFLFGLSFALMLTRSTDSDGRFLSRYAWRLVVLGGIAFLHCLHWRGDILSIYALLGFPLLLFRKVSLRWVLTVGILLALNVPTLVRNLYNEYLTTPPNKAQNEQRRKAFDETVKANYAVIKQGSYADVARVNLAEFKTKMEFQFNSGRIYITLGFFLLGLYAGRRRLFQQLPENRIFFRRITRYCGFGVLGIILFFAAVILGLGGNPQVPKAVEFIFSLLIGLGEAGLTVFYIAGLTLLFQKVSWRGVASSLASVGKLALTNYVLQSILGTFLFYGYGLGLLGDVSTAVAASLTLPIFLTQLLLSRWWLARFQYGPLEWLWRSLTYGKVQPMRT